MRMLLFVVLLALFAGSLACGGEPPEELPQTSQGLERASRPAIEKDEPAATIRFNLPPPDDDPVPIRGVSGVVELDQETAGSRLHRITH